VGKLSELCPFTVDRSTLAAPGLSFRTRSATNLRKVGVVGSSQSDQEQSSGQRDHLRGILVGCGYISTAQLEAWAKIPEAEIVALVDTDGSKAAEQAERFGVNATYSDLASALEEHDVDFVDLATPPPTHLDLVRTAAAAGANILCQKPLAPTLAEVDEMIRVADRAGVSLVANENMRFQPWFRKTKELLDSGAIGRPFYVRMSNRGRSTLPTATFATQPYFATMPRLIVYEMGVHLLDTLRYLVGEPSTLTGAIGHANQDIAGEDHAAVLLTYDKLIATIESSWAAVSVWTTDNRVGWADVTIDGEKGSIHLSADGRLRLLTDEPEQSFQYGPDSISDSFLGMQCHFVECITGVTDCETSGTEYAKTMELVFGTYASAASGQVYRVGEDRHTLA